MKKKGYVAFIDGLRAVAVLAVIIYHLEPSFLPGGFVGVDVFFVISGFVVTASLAGHGHERLRSFLSHFYARRLARLIPALVTMLLATTLAYVLLVPKAWFNRAASDAGLAAFWGLSNLVLDWRTVDYFALGAERNPYTHTWSLGVEEQFYVVAPLLLFVALRKPAAGRHKALAITVIGLLCLASLVATYHYGLTRGADFVFYQLAFRFWELGVGVLLFLTLPLVQHFAARLKAHETFTGLAGVLLIAGAMVVPNTEFAPFIRATVAVVGAALLISVAHANPSDPVRHLLASKSATWVGKRSYSLYLWHWPVYVIAVWTVGLNVWPFNLGAILLTFALAALSFSLLERPIRASAVLRSLPTNVRIGFFIFVIAAGWFTSFWLMKQQPILGLGKVTREAGDWYEDREMVRTARAAIRQCDPEPRSIDGGRLLHPEGCVDKASAQLFVIGDSHAGAYSPLLEQLSAEDGRSVYLLGKPGCSFLDFLDAIDEASNLGCYEAARAAQESVLAKARFGDIVFLSSLRLPRFVDLGQRGIRYGPDGPNGDIFSWNKNELQGLERASLDAPRWIEPFVKAGLKVVIEAPKPVFRAHPFACVESWNRTNPECAAGLEENRADIERFRTPVLNAMTTIAVDYPSVTIWDPLPLLCEESICGAVRDGRPLFFDGDHLSPYGNLVLFEPFQREIDRVEYEPLGANGAQSVY